MIDNSEEEEEEKVVCKPFLFLFENEISCRRHPMRVEMHPLKIRLPNLLNGRVD